MKCTPIRRTAKKAFTLVEILIVVIILGILAAIVIPQFTNASTDARKSSLTSQLQTLRSQISLYALQHTDQYPTQMQATSGTVAGATAWNLMTVKTNADQTTTGTPLLGPYLQAAPVNNLNGLTDVGFVTGTTDFGSGGVANPAGACGWVFNSTTGKIWATTTLKGYIYNEGNAGDPNNLQ